MVYNILEIANTHGGNTDYVMALLQEFSAFDQHMGVKFQPFRYDRIAMPDFSWYSVYEELYFDLETWGKIFCEANKTKDIWIDVFDTYSAEVIETHSDLVYGIKMQASVLYNLELLQALEALDLSKKKLIINIAAYPLEEIRATAARIEEQLQPEELILQIGFQAYPTQLEDSGLSKIKVLQDAFPERALSYTEHLAGEVPESLTLPAMAAMLGVQYIEKHIMHSSLPTPYDHFSSVKVDQYQQYYQHLKQYQALLKQPFINQAEEQYLYKSLQIPVLKCDKKAGQCLSLERDVTFKRTDSKGLNVAEVQKLLDGFHVLSTDKKAGDTLLLEDFRKANIAAVVACRMKSSRLPEKALLSIGSLSSVALCLKNVLRFERVNHVVLATSTVEQDAPLAQATYREDVIFHQGDPDDVIQRFIGVADRLHLDVIVRLTADCPFLSNEIAQRNLEAHFKHGADYTSAPKATVGTNAEIINVSALRTIKEHFPTADYSEYMTFYFTNNPDHFHLHEVELPKELVSDYRLTLDYQEDLDMLSAVQEHFEETQQGVYSTQDILRYLDEHPEVAAINQNIGLVYKQDKGLIERIRQHSTIDLA